VEAAPKNEKNPYIHFFDTRDDPCIIAKEDAKKATELTIAQERAPLGKLTRLRHDRQKGALLETKHEPKAAKEAMRIPIIGDFWPLSRPEPATTAPPPGIFEEIFW